MRQLLWTSIVAGSVMGSVLMAAEKDVFPKTNAKLAANEAVKIVCLGDSVTGIYYHTGGMRAYPEMIAIGLQKLHPEAKVTAINAGISGQSTVNGLARLEKDVLAHQPDLVTIMFGLNDMVRVSPDDYQANLKIMIDRCRGIGAEVLLCTPNGIIDSPARPQPKLEEYNQLMRDVGQQTKTPVCDVYAAYQAVKQADPLAFRLLCSDPFHPNMDGHKLNAEVICKTITGKDVSLNDVGPPPALARTRKVIEAKQPVRVFAMTPIDQWIGPAIKAKYPDAQVEVTAWPTKDQSLPKLHEAAKAIRQMNPKPDLVVLAIPLEITPLLSKPSEDDINNYTWTMNYALSFALQEWDVIAIAPSVLQEKMTSEELDREAFARRMINAQHLDLIARPEGSPDDAATILKKCFAR